MGYEADCHARYEGEESDGKALLEGDRLIFRGDFRISIPFAQMRSVEARKGHLVVTTPTGVAVFDLGEEAEPWMRRILSPKPLVAKLGIVEGHRVLLEGVDDAAFRAQLGEAKSTIVADDDPVDAIFLAAGSREELAAIPRLAARLVPNGALWVVRPKGREEITEKDVMDAGRAAGLVDVKVVRFSDTHTAEKFVIPVGKRPK